MGGNSEYRGFHLSKLNINDEHVEYLDFGNDYLTDKQKFNRGLVDKIIENPNIINLYSDHFDLENPEIVTYLYNRNDNTINVIYLGNKSKNYIIKLIEIFKDEFSVLTFNINQQP
jgi:hypothetical protein